MNLSTRTKKFENTLSNLINANKINSKDTVFLHIKLRNIKKEYKIPYKRISEIIVECFKKKKVSNILVPAFHYSFSKTKKFDKNKTVSENGFFSEFFRKKYSTYRTNDPFYSVCHLKDKSKQYLKKKIDFNTSFKKNTIWQELLNSNVTIVNIGLDYLIITLIHYLEYDRTVPYRAFFKRKGYKKINNKFSPITYNLYGRKNMEEVGLDWPKIEKFLIKKKIIKKAGNSSINFKCFKIKDAAKVLKPQIKNNPYFLVMKLKKNN